MEWLLIQLLNLRAARRAVVGSCGVLVHHQPHLLFFSNVQQCPSWLDTRPAPD